MQVIQLDQQAEASSTDQSTLMQEDYARFLDEYGFTEGGVRRIVDYAADHVPITASEWPIEFVRSPIHGTGMMARRHISEGESIAPGRIGKGRPLPGRFTNHSGIPNALMRAEPWGLMIVARCPIEQGREITLDYRQVASVNGWGLIPSLAQTRNTVRWRAECLPLTNWAKWRDASEGDIAELLDAIGYLPSMQDAPGRKGGGING